MEHYEIPKMLIDSYVYKLVTKTCIEVNDSSSGQYSVSNKIRFKTLMLWLNLCDYSDVYIVVKGMINVTDTSHNNRKNKKLIVKNNVPLAWCRTKPNKTFLDNAGDLYIVMQMYKFLEYSDYYSMTSGSSWNYWRDGINDHENETDDNRSKLNNNKKTISKYFKYKTKIIGITPDNANRLKAEVLVPLKHLSKFWNSLDLPLSNFEIELELRWAKNFTISEISRAFRATDPNADPFVYKIKSQTASATFQINNAKLYNPVVTLSINDNIKFLENI